MGSELISAIVGNKRHLPKAARRANDTVFDRIFKYYYDEKRRHELTEEEELIRQRWELAWLHLSGLTPKKLIVRRLEMKFGVHFTTGYADIKYAEKLFGDSAHQNKAAKKAIISNMLEKAIKKAFNNAEWKAFEKLLLRYDQYNGLNREDNTLEDLIKNMKPLAITFSADPETLQKQSDDLIRDVEDVEFEDLTNEPDDKGKATE